MRKYSLEFKLKVIKEYKSGKYGGYKSVGKRNDVPVRTLVGWLHRYDTFGISELKGTKPKKYTSSFKEYVLKYIKNNQISLKEAAILFKIKCPSRISEWEKAMRKKDEESSKNNKRKEKELMKKEILNIKKTSLKKQIPLNETEREELNRLRKEVEYLKLTEIYLKKLDALLQKEDKETRKKR